MCGMWVDYSTIHAYVVMSQFVVRYCIVSDGDRCILHTRVHVREFSALWGVLCCHLMAHFLCLTFAI